MKKIILLLFLFAFPSSLTFAQLEDDTNQETVDDILNIYFQAIGQNNLLKTNTYVSKGKIIQGNAELPFTSYNKRPMYYRLETEMEGEKIISAFNGDSGWTINPILSSSEPQPMTSDEMERSKLAADYDGMFYNYAEKGYKVEFIDKEDVGFVETYVLKLTTQVDDEITAYFDTENNVMLKLSSYIMIQETAAELEMFFSHHRFVNDILVPFTIETKVNGNTEMKMMVEQVSFDVNVPDSLFEIPESSESVDSDQ
jgi:outer membrane lipoprotein-sorting protein